MSTFLDERNDKACFLGSFCFDSQTFGNVETAFSINLNKSISTVSVTLPTCQKFPAL